MNKFLAELYDTAGNIGADNEDLEKDAAAEFLVKLAEEEGVDLGSLSDEEIGSLLSEVEKDAAASEDNAENNVDEETQEKLAEADFLGRTMAHAYVDELADIEKQAAAPGRIAKALGRVGEWSGVSGIGAARKLRRAAEAEKGQFSRAIKGLAAKSEKGTTSIRSLGKQHAQAARNVRAFREAGRESKKQFAKRVGAPAAGLAATGYGASKLFGKEKKSFNEEFEIAAQERAYQMLHDAGYDIEKVAQADVDIRALQMLEEAGYPVEWNQE